MAQSEAQKRAVVAHRERLQASGGSRLSILLPPDVTKALAALCEGRGQSRTVVISDLIMKAKK